MRAPYGSTLNDPNVQSALQGLASVEVPDIAGAGTQSPSTLNDPAVQEAMRNIVQTQEALPVTVCTVKNALNGGELSPEMLARFDLPRYQLGCEKLLNMIPLPGGGLTKRPGFRFVSGAGSGSDDSGARLVPFSYSADEQIMLMILANAGGGQLYILDRDGSQAARPDCKLPYRKSELKEVSFCQCGKVVYIAHKNHRPAKLVWDGSGFSYERIDFSNKTPSPEIENLEIVGIPNEYWGWRHYKVTAINDETGEESMPSEVMSLQTSTLTSSFMCRVTIKAVAGCSEYRVYRKRGGEYGFIGRTSTPLEGDESDPPQLYEFLDQGYEPDVSDPPPKEQEFFENPGDYPSIVFLHQQRLGWAATDNDPLTIWMSQTSNFECLASKTPPQDDDAIEATLASTQANRILWAVSDRSGLAIGTTGEEWYLTGAGGEGVAVTPNSLSFQPQTRYGTQPGVGAMRANASLLFVQRGGRIVRDLGYSYQSDRYEAQDLTMLARHIFRYAAIMDWCWQGSPNNIMWCVTEAGNLAGLTYMPEHEVVAWHRHYTAGKVLGCATLDDSSGISRLWIVVKREIDGVSNYYAEMLDKIFEGDPDTWDGISFGSPEPYHADGQAKTSFEARCIPCLPEIGMENGSTCMRVKKINAIRARVINSRPFKCRVISQNANPSGRPSSIPSMPFMHDVPAKSLSSNDRLSRRSWAAEADWSCPIGAGFRDGAKLELVFDGPAPVTLLGLAVTMEVAREGGGQI